MAQGGHSGDASAKAQPPQKNVTQGEKQGQPASQSMGDKTCRNK